MNKKDLVLELRTTALGHPKTKPLVCVSNDTQLTTAIKLHGERRNVNFVWIRSKVSDPLYAFWQLEHRGCLEEKCYVVFTEIKGAPRWGDVREMYDLCEIGDMVIMVYDSNAKARPVPSQRGLKVKRGKKNAEEDGT